MCAAHSIARDAFDEDDFLPSWILCAPARRVSRRLHRHQSAARAGACARRGRESRRCAAAGAARISRRLGRDGSQHRLAQQTRSAHGAATCRDARDPRPRASSAPQRDRASGASGRRCDLSLVARTVVGVSHRETGPRARAPLRSVTRVDRRRARSGSRVARVVQSLPRPPPARDFRTRPEPSREDAPRRGQNLRRADVDGPR